MVQKMREDVERLNGLLRSKDALLDQARRDAQAVAEQLSLLQEKAGRTIVLQTAADKKILGLQQQVAARDEQLATLSQNAQDAEAARVEAQSRQQEIQAQLQCATHDAAAAQAEAARLRGVRSDAQGGQQEIATRLQSAWRECADLQRQLDDVTDAHAAALKQAEIAANELVIHIMHARYAL